MACNAGSVRLDFGLTSPHHVNSTAAASSYGNLSVFNPREDFLDAADPDQQSTSQPLSSTRFKNRFACYTIACVVNTVSAGGGGRGHACHLHRVYMMDSGQW